MTEVTRSTMLSPYDIKQRREAYKMDLYRVLLVEDDFDDQMLEKKELMRLSNVGKVICFPNGKELLEYLEKKTSKDKEFLQMAPIAIILDLQMPLMNGFEVLKTLKSDKRFQNITVLVVTGQTKAWDKEKAVVYNANAVLEKPLNVQKLRTVLTNTKHTKWNNLWSH